VSTAGNDLTGTGTAANPFATIQNGIAHASAGDTVMVAGGIYHEHDIAMKSGIMLLSETGYADCVKIDADSLGRVFYCEDADSLTTIKGFTITGGSSPNSLGGGMYCIRSSVNLVNCLFTGNRVSSGGGMYCGSSSPRLTDCTFSNNHARSGGGMLCEESYPRLTDCIFTDNRAEYWGGGIKCSHSSPDAVRCVFAGNSTGIGSGGGVQCGHGCFPDLTNCTFYGNTSGASLGGGIYLHYNCHATLTNSIIAFNGDSTAIMCEPTTASAILTCCDIYGNAGGDWVGCIAEQDGINGNFSEDPMFCNPVDGDYHLLESSPCAAAQQPVCGLIGASGAGCCAGVPQDTDRREPEDLDASFCYPNPFKPHSRMNFAVPAGCTTASVAIRVYDCTGRLVCTLTDGTYGPGNHTLVWDGRAETGDDVASGVYFVRISRPGRHVTKRLILLR
jgi:hypothetical protein